MVKSVKEEVYRFIREWKDRLYEGQWPECFRDILRIGNGDVEMPENVLEDAREAAVLLAASFMPRRREMLQMAVRQGRFDVLPALLRVHDNCHDEEFGLTAAQTAALTSHVASVCVLAKHDITTLYDQGVRRNTAYDVLFSVLCDKLVVTDPDNLTPACIYTYGENAACSLGHASSASIVSPTPIELGVKIVKDCTISLGRYHTLFLIDGIVYSCGLGRDGKLGHGNESDVLVPQEVFLGNRRVVAISAGPNHSVICTKKEVIVFGRNECGQLGIDAANALSPTIAYVLKKPNAEITECFAGATFSAVLTSQGQCIACGSLPWDSSRPSEFIVSLNAIFAQHTVHFFDKCVVGLQVFYGQTKVDVLSSRGGFSTRLSEQYECEGVIETSPLVILLKSFGKDWQEPVFCVVYQHPETDVVICVEVNFVTNEPFASIQLQSVQLSPHGEFVAVSPNFIIYEGCINEDAILSSSSHEPTSKCRVCVELNRVVGLPPAMKAFISTDGRNKALLTYTIPADKLVTLQERTSTTSAIEETGETGESVEVVCLDREGKEVEVFKARRNALIEESDYCKTFFFRWCETENQVKHISFFEEASLVATFLRYCERSLQLNELTKQEMFELMHFADQYACQRLFIDVLNTVIHMPFTLSTLRDLYEVSRSVTNEELNRCVDVLGAYLLPLMLSRGLAQQLTAHELYRIERQYSSLVKNECCPEVDDQRICQLVIELFDNFAILFAHLSEDFDFEEMLNAFLREEKRRSSKILRQVPKSPSDHKALASSGTVSKKEKQFGESNEEKSASEVLGEGLCELQLSSTAPPLSEIADTKIASDSASSKSPMADGNTLGSCICASLKNPVSEAITVPASKRRATLSLPLSSSSEPWISSSVDAIRSDFSKIESATTRRSKHEQVQSTSRIVPSRTERPLPWGGFSPSAMEPLSEILADEARRAVNSQQNKRPVKVKQTPQKENRGESKGWYRESTPVQSIEQPCGLVEIMAAEAASQNEAKRLNASRLIDIDIEEQAITELMEAYEAEATISGVSVTISAERFRATVSEPLWAARC